MWLQRNIKPDEEATHALVVGVSRYDKLPENEYSPEPEGVTTLGLKQVHSPALSAFRFARWLRDTYHNPAAPLASVRLLLSPSDAEKEKEAELWAVCCSDQTIDYGDGRLEVRPVQTAEWRNVEQAHKDWVAACSRNKRNVALLYASGHGLYITEKDSYVLLQDFALENKPFRASLDIAGIQRGLVGPTMAQTQFYFIDACRVPPPENCRDMPNPGDGISWNGKGDGSERSLEIFFSAAPSQLAIGRRGMPTLFNEAMMEILDGTAFVKHPSGRFVITPALMLQLLREKVRKLSKRRQKVAHSDQGEVEAFHVFPEAPKVTVQVALKPPDGARSALAKLRAGSGQCLREKQVFDPHPLVLADLEPALYTLDIEFDPVMPPYSPRTGFIIRAEQVPVPLHEVDFL